MADESKIKFSQFPELTEAAAEGTDYFGGYTPGGDNKRMTLENMSGFMLHKSNAGEAFKDNFVKVSETEPQSADNRIWVKDGTTEEVEVPTYEEFNELKNNNSYNILYGLFSTVTKTIAGVTYAFEGNHVTVSGASTGTSVYVLLPGSVLPSDMVPGHTYPVKYETSSNDVRLRIIYRDSSGTTLSTTFYVENGVTEVPADAVSWTIGLVVVNGKTFVTPESVLIGGILSAKTNLDISTDIAQETENRVSADTELMVAFHEHVDDMAGVTEIEMVDGAYIDCSGSTVNLNAPVAHASYRYAVVECSRGDLFSIKGTGGSASRLYAFVNTSGGVIAVANSNLTVTDYLEIIAPESASFLVLNDKSKAVSYIGRMIKSRVTRLEERAFNDLSSNSFWEQGGISSASGAIAGNATRIRTPLIPNVVKTVRCAPHVKYAVFVYDPHTSNYLGLWNGSSIEKSVHWFNSLSPYNGRILGQYKIRILGARTVDSRDIAPSEYASFAIEVATDYTMSAYGEAADAGVCSDMISDAANNNTNLVVISHRGTRLTRPDSTSSAYIHAKECGFSYAEGDLQRTRDGHYVIGHDNSILSRTGIDANISDMDLSELKALDFGVHLFPEYAGQAILTLEEFLQLCNNLGLKPVLDFKTKTEEQVAEIMEILDCYGLDIYNMNGSLQTLKYILALRPNQFVRRSYETYTATVESEINSLFTDFPDAKFMVAYNYGPSWTDGILLGIKSRGIDLCVYEVNSGSAFESQLMAVQRYYVHTIMCGGDFNPTKYALKRDNNILVPDS